MEGFPSILNATFTSTRGCTELMCPMCQLKVKVTVKCQILNKQILDFMPCPLYKPYTNGRIPWMCRAHVAHVSPQGQGHNWRSNIKQSNIRQYVVSVSPTLIKRFALILAQMFTSTRECAEPMLDLNSS